MKYISIPVEDLRAWCLLNDVTLNGIELKSSILTSDGVSKGGGVVSTAVHESEEVLLSVPSELILSKEAVAQYAKINLNFARLAEALTTFTQMTLCDPAAENYRLSAPDVFTGYYQALPKTVPLPTFLTEEQRELLQGTSLYEAVEQKLVSLEKEFDQLRELTAQVPWCRELWWDATSGQLDFDDWLLVDALYRSRALDLPRVVGDAMVPILDMANHADDDRYNARFEIGQNGQVLLVVRDGKTIQAGEEILINYGAGGASEMLFSYGFLEENISSAREMFLSLRVPDDDPLRLAKLRYAKEMPGLRIFVSAGSSIDWESAFVWWMCVNEEDGLDFQVLETTDGQRELQATWHEVVTRAEEFKTTVLADQLRDVFLLRATVIIQQRIEQQGEQLAMTEENFEASAIRQSEEMRYLTADVRRLRNLELELLTSLYQTLEEKKQKLLISRSVAEYLSRSQDPEEPEIGGQQEENEDFS